MDLRGPVTVALTFSTTRQALARQLVMRLAEAITPAVIDKLNTPPAFSMLGKEEAVALFIADIMECAGIPATQAPPPAAYGPTGGLKVIDEAGGQLLSRDKQALFDVPGTTAEGGPAVVGPHLFAMAEVPLGSSGPSIAASASPLCLPPRERVMEVGRCYDFSVTPDVGAHALNQGFGGRGVYTAVCSPGGLNPDHTANPDDEVHNYLELAKVNHEDPTKFTIYERQHSSAAEALACDLGAGPLPPSTSALGGAWSKLSGALALLARPFTPTIARASDGIGHDLLDYTRARLVYQTKPMTVSPTSSTVTTDASETFTAAGPRPGPFTWSVNGIDVVSRVPTGYGTFDIGKTGLSAVYFAPSTVPTVGMFDVCVRRTLAPADRGCSAITVQGNFVGNWSGTIFYQNSTPQPITLNVTSQTASSASGELFIATANDPTPYNTTSHFTGVVDGNNLSFTMTQFTPNGGAVVNLTRSGDGLSGTMAELFSGELGRVFTANLSRSVVITMRGAATRPSLSVSASPNASASTSASGPVFGTRAP